MSKDIVFFQICVYLFVDVCPYMSFFGILEMTTKNWPNVLHHLKVFAEG